MAKKGFLEGLKKAILSSQSSSFSSNSDSSEEGFNEQGVEDQKAAGKKSKQSSSVSRNSKSSDGGADQKLAGKISKKEAAFSSSSRVAKKKRNNMHGKQKIDLDESSPYTSSDDNDDYAFVLKGVKRSPGKEKKKTDLVDNLPVDNVAITNHVKFMKQMKGHIPKAGGLSRLFQLITTGPKLVNGEVFSDITTVQSTLDFLLGLINDPSATLEQINNIVSSIDDFTFSCYHGVAYDSNVYCKSNNFESGFTLQLLKQLKESIHLKYCVSAVSSSLFMMCLAKRFRDKTCGSLEERFVRNVFLKKLLGCSSNMFNLVHKNVKSFIKILLVYGHVYYYDELFMQHFWDRILPQYLNKIGMQNKKENLELIKGTLGTIQKMLENLLENLGNCITYYCWVHSIQNKVTEAGLVEQIATIFDKEINKSIDISKCYFKDHNDKNMMVAKFVTEIRYMFLHSFGHHKLCNVKMKLFNHYNIKERD